MAISYEKQTVNAPNPLVRFSHRSRITRSLDFAKRVLPEKGTFVDFGAGQGLLLHQLRKQFADAQLIGIEPFMELRFPGSARYIRDFSELSTGSVDVVSAFEVCEHLRDDELATFVDESLRVLKRDGKLLISVPIMLGGAVVLKTLNHRLLHGNTDMSVGEVARSTLGRPVSRAVNVKNSHKGFDFRHLIKQVSSRFELIEQQHSPIPILPWFLNSQAFLLFLRR